jgi:hypothetical protein
MGRSPDQSGKDSDASTSNWTIAEACRTGRKDRADAPNRETVFACDDLGRDTQVRLSPKLRESYNYDVMSNLRSKAVRKGQASVRFPSQAVCRE